MECVNTANTSSNCLPPCSGSILTSFSKSINGKNLLSILSREIDAYRKYTKWSQFPSDLKEYEWENKLRFVRIYFDTPTFDRITKDRAAKFVDMLSAIGGTMGLLTGFSIISAVEIIYFGFKIVIGFSQKKTLFKTHSI